MDAGGDAADARVAMHRGRVDERRGNWSANYQQQTQDGVKGELLKVLQEGRRRPSAGATRRAGRRPLAAGILEAGKRP